MLLTGRPEGILLKAILIRAAAFSLALAVMQMAAAPLQA
jgi:hypothetical protein